MVIFGVTYIFRMKVKMIEMKHFQLKSTLKKLDHI